MIASASVANSLSNNPQDAWQECKRVLQERLSVVEYNTWIEPVVAHSLDQDVFKLIVPNRFHRDYLTRRVDIASASASVLGRPVRIGFVEEEKSFSTQETSVADRGQPISRELRPVGLTGGLSAQNNHDVAIAQTTSRLQALSETGLQHHYSFDRFVEGRCNQVAAGIGKMLVQAGNGQPFNPLILYGASGVGKTHLLQAIGNLALEKRMRVRYLTSEKFASAFVGSVKGKSAYSFVKSFSHLDLLIVDDVQFLGRTEKIQDQFAAVFNSLVNENRQVVLSFDQQPNKISGLNDALVSRFQGGVMAELSPPGFETRRQIVQQRAVELGLELDPDTLDTVARTRGSVRQIEGILNRLLAEQKFGFEAPAIGSLIAEVTGDTLGALQLKDIARVVSEKTEVPVDIMRGRSRRRPHVQARHLAMYLARVVSYDTYTKIAAFFDGRDHSSVMHGVKSIEDLRDVDEELNTLVEELLQKLGAM